MTAIAAWNSGQQNLTGDGDPLRVGVGLVTANTFEVLGARPMLGRAFTAEEDVPNGAAGRRPRLSAVAGALRRRSKHHRTEGPVQRRAGGRSSASCPRGSGCRPTSPRMRPSPRELWRPQQLRHDLAQSAATATTCATLAPGQTAASGHRGTARADDAATEQGAYPERDAVHGLRRAIDEEIRGGIRPALWMLIGAVGSCCSSRARTSRTCCSCAATRDCARWRCAPPSARRRIVWCGS